MTKEEALTMIVASIAMEELALSHIINAEGEKLQYVLAPGRCAGSEEVLAVNRSIRELLDTVTQNQMLLKGKLERALEACASTPSCCGERPKSAIQLAGRCGGFSWDNGSALSWKCQGQRGGGIRWDEKIPALVRLDGDKIYTLDYTVNVRSPYPGRGSVCVKLTPGGAFSGVLPLYFSAKGRDCEPMTLHGSAMLFPQACRDSGAGLSLVLKGQESLFVDQAVLSIAEV